MLSGSALLVIDMQAGAFDGERCPPVGDASTLLDHTRQLLASARAVGVPPVFVQHCASAGGVLAEGTSHWALHGDVTPRQHERVLHKHESSAFAGTALNTLLQELGVHTLIVCGLQSEACVANTAVAALGLGFRVVVAEDAHSTWPSASRAARDIAMEQNQRLASLGARAVPTAEVVRMLHAQAPWRASKLSA